MNPADRLADTSPEPEPVLGEAEARQLLAHPGERGPSDAELDAIEGRVIVLKTAALSMSEAFHAPRGVSAREIRRVSMRRFCL